MTFISPDPRAGLWARYQEVRQRTEELSAPLSAEDQQIQSMPLCSPTKWHRAHTTWFFERFVLGPLGVLPVHAGYSYLFNSYYESCGPHHSRCHRGLLSRPSADEVTRYRRLVDGRMRELLDSIQDAELLSFGPAVELGIAHEEQHQELILTDILHAFAENPLKPEYRPPSAIEPSPEEPVPLRFVEFGGGLLEIGANPTDGFVFDNETPRHRSWLEPFALSNRLLTVAELEAFILDRGYHTPSLWLSEGLEWARALRVEAPLYCRREGSKLLAFTLEGERLLAGSDPVSHVSFYEADALSRYLGARLPTEEEWESAAAQHSPSGHFLENGPLRAAPAVGTGIQQLYGDTWEWTRSSYQPYPAFKPKAGALGEYNAKFMINQSVLRGGSFATPKAHIRATYRNFWHPETRFQITGIRLAKGL